MTIGEIIADLRTRGFEVEAKETEPTLYRVVISKPICDFMGAKDLEAWYRHVMCLDIKLKGD